MDNRQIIKALVKHSGTCGGWETFTRYIFILDNYLRNQPLSKIEPQNHAHNEPRAYYLDLLAQGFNLTIDYESVLFANRINRIHQRFIYSDDSAFYQRFFTRLTHFRNYYLPITEESVKDMLRMGSLAFKQKYKF